MFQRAVLTLIACSLLVLQAAGVGAAGNPDNGPGCGLGKLAWMDYGGQKQIAPQVMMATTNGTFGSQTFGISSGTSGCTNDGVIIKNKHLNMASRAFESLAEEMAQGRGEASISPPWQRYWEFPRKPSLNFSRWFKSTTLS